MSPKVLRLFPFALVLGLLAGVVLTGGLTEVAIAHLMGDTTSLARVPPYFGAVSVLGLFVWSAAIAVCLYSAALLRRLGARPEARFLALSGALTTVLLVDDGFLLHEHGWYLGVPSTMVFLAYGLMVAVLFIRYRDVARAHVPGLLGLAVAFLGLSVVFDKLHDAGLHEPLGPHATAISMILEDGFKLLGIVGWLNYYVWASRRHLADAVPALWTASRP